MMPHRTQRWARYTPTVEPEENPELARATQAILKAKNLTVNSASARLKIDRGVLTRMSELGTPPRLDVLERFARKLRLDVNEWRVLAGYEPVLSATPDSPSPYEALILGIRDLSLEFGRPVLHSFDHEYLTGLTHEGAEQQLAELRRQLEAGAI